MARSTRKPPRKPSAKGHPPAVQAAHKKRRRAITPPATPPKTVLVKVSAPMGLETVASVTTSPAGNADLPLRDIPPGRSTQELPQRPTIVSPALWSAIEARDTPTPLKAATSEASAVPAETTAPSPTTGDHASPGSSRRRRNEGLLSSTGASEPPFPPDAPTARNTVALSGTASGRSSAFGTLTARIVLPPEWTAQRDEIARQLADIQSAIGEILPLVQFIEQSMRQPKRDGLGGNNPPEPIDEPPIGTADLAEIGAAARTLSDVNAEQQQAAPIQLSHLVLKRAEPKVGALSAWLKSKGNLFVDEYVKALGRRAGERTIDAAWLLAKVTLLSVAINAVINSVGPMLQALHLLP